MDIKNHIKYNVQSDDKWKKSSLQNSTGEKMILDENEIYVQPIVMLNKKDIVKHKLNNVKDGYNTNRFFIVQKIFVTQHTIKNEVSIFWFINALFIASVNKILFVFSIGK